MPDPARHIWHYQNENSAFSNSRAQLIDKANKIIWQDTAGRFGTDAETPARARRDSAGNYLPDLVQHDSDNLGEMRGPGGSTWYYDMRLHYYSVYHNEYFTEHIPDFFRLTVYDSDMKEVGVIQDSLRIQADEARVRQVSVLQLVSQHYYNTDDRYEIAVNVLVNPKPYGIRARTYIYQLGDEPASDGCTRPVSVESGSVSNVLDASADGKENYIMTYVTEGNSSGLGESALKNPETFWLYHLGNYQAVNIYGPADESGKHQHLFSSRKIYYQYQGNQQDDPVVMMTLHDGKATLIYPYYEKVFYKPYYSINDDLQADEGNRLIIEIWEQPAPGENFVLRQTTPIDVINDDTPDVIWSYYGIGAFRWTSDVVWNGEQADFIVTRRDYIATSESERLTYLIYNADGSLRKVLFENAQSFMTLSDLPGFDPQAVFIGTDGMDYIFNIMNMRTLEIDLALNYGLKFNDDDDPDYIMANIDRTLTPDGKSFQYVAEMRMPEYDDVNDCNYMRVAWISRDGKPQRIDKVNMGNKVNYAKLYIQSQVLRPGFFHSDDTQEYMMLIKRAIGDGSSRSVEQLLVGQALSDSLPTGKDLLLLGPCEYGKLSYITAFNDGNHDRLNVLYSGARGTTSCTYYLPLDKDFGSDPGHDGIGTIVSDDASADAASGAATRYYNLQGQPVDIRTAPEGIYLRVTPSGTSKVLKK